MTNTEILKSLYENGFFLNDGRVNPQAKRKLIKFPSILSSVKVRLPFLDISEVSFAQIVHALRNNLESLPTCPICLTQIKFDKSSSQYHKTCSPKCGAIFSPNKAFKLRDVTKDSEIMNKRIANRKSNYRKGKKAKLQDKDWLFEKHVNQCYSMVELSKLLGVTPQTIRKTLDNFQIQSPSIGELRKYSTFRKYGVFNVGELPEVREKARMKDTLKRKGGWVSTAEKEILHFVQNILPNSIIQENTQRIISPQELDIYIPDYKLAIEYCGLYWHSDNFKENYYHRNKMKACNEQGIRLLTVFEDEWLQNRNIVESKIKNILGLDDRQLLYARKTKIVPVSQSEKLKFLDKNHIQGSGPGSITYGLEYQNSLVAVMTFIKRQHGKYELNRYATSHRVVGGFSKLLKHFQRTNDWTEIVSFADLRWSTGNLYDATDWELDKTLPPDYYWCKNRKRYHKFGFRHKHLANKLEHYDPTLTENDNCKNHGYYKVFHCGLKRYKLTNTNR